jgi:DNA-binding transcriptional ArsR family regulator
MSMTANRKSYSRAIPAPWRRTAKIFTALGDDHRQRVLLMFGKGERFTQGDIVAASTLSRSAVAHHLRILLEAGVLKREKIGREVWLWPDLERVATALDDVRDYLRALQK